MGDDGRRQAVGPLPQPDDLLMGECPAKAAFVEHGAQLSAEEYLQLLARDCDELGRERCGNGHPVSVTA